MTGEAQKTYDLIAVRDLAVAFDGVSVLDGVTLQLHRHEVLGVIGASGSGKSVTMRAILGLVSTQRGVIDIFGQPYVELDRKGRLHTEKRWGVLFQQGALFSALTVLENVEFPIREHRRVSSRLRREMAMIKLDLVGLPVAAAARYPAELSGGMIKRAALARALALDPEILFLDEPTAGLDPIGATRFDELIATLRATLDLTVFMVTHDLDTLAAVSDRIVALGHGKVLASGSIAELGASDDPWLKDYFHGPRAARSERAS